MERRQFTIIGTGITGLFCAYYLNKAGQKVRLIEKGDLGHGASSINMGFLTMGSQAFLEKIQTHYPEHQDFLMALIQKNITDNEITGHPPNSAIF